jgi:hypothetical protein
MQRFFLTASAIVALSVSCSSPATYPSPSPGAPTSIGLGISGPFDEEARMFPGGTFQVLATAHYGNGPGENVTNTASWQSSDPSVASISQQGVLTTLAAGTTLVTATFQGTAGTLTVTVSSVP